MYRSICALILAACFCVGASARDVFFIDSQGNAERVVPGDPKHAMPDGPWETTAKAGGITFNVAYQDAAGVGFNDATRGAARKARVQDIFTYLNQVLNQPGGVCDVTFKPSLNSGTGALASAGTFFFAHPGFSNGTAFDHITMGVDTDPGTADIECTVDFGWDWYEGTATSFQFGLIDLRSVLIHELTHGLGFASNSQANGTSFMYPVNAYTYWDSFLYTGNGKKLFVPAFQGVASDLTGGAGGLVFKGPGAMSLYGGAVPVYAPNPYKPGSSVSHWNSLAAHPVMNPAIASNVIAREYKDYELAALGDIGYTVNLNITYTLTTSVLPAGKGTITANPTGPTYARNALVNLTANPAAGYAFDHWTGPVANTASASTTITMTDNLSVTANFVPTFSFLAVLMGGGWKEVGQPLTLQVAVSGTAGAVSYQWIHNDINIPGATQAVYHIDAVGYGDSGWYKCQVTDQAKSVHMSSSTLVNVFAGGALPASGVPALAAMVVALCIFAVRSLRRRVC